MQTDGSIEAKLGFWSRNSKWLIGACVVIAGLAYVIRQVNPDTIAAYMVQAERQKIFRCLVKELQRENIDRIKIMECAE